jgi:hypothetical protein
MEIATRFSLKGTFFWEILDENGEVVEAETSDGRKFFPDKVHDNLITNYGLDQFAVSTTTADSRWWLTSGASVGGQRRYLRVGTGSTAPAFTDVALVDQHAFTAVNGANIGLIEFGTFEDVASAKLRVQRRFTATTDVTLTEWGFSSETSGNNLSIRELFRDNLGDPISVVVKAGKTLQLTHDLTYSCNVAVDTSGTWSVNFIDFENQSTPTSYNTDNYIEFSGGTLLDTAVKAQSLFDNVLYPGRSSYAGRLVTYTLVPGLTADRTSNVGATTSNVLGELVGDWTLGDYTSGAFEITRSVLFNQAVSNGSIGGYAFMYRPATTGVPAGSVGFVVLMDSGSVTKTLLDRFTVRMKISWGRALY